MKKTIRKRRSAQVKAQVALAGHQSLGYLTPAALYFGRKEYDREELALRR